MLPPLLDGIDFLLLPVYIFILYKIAKYYQNKYYANEPETSKIFIWGFWAKIFSAVLFALITEYYFKNGDTFIYSEEGSKLFKWSLQNPANLSYIFSPAENFDTLKALHNDTDNPGFTGFEGNFMPIRFVAFLSFFCFNKYLILSVFFSMFSFIGLWKLYQSFSFFYPNLIRVLALPFLFLPSVLFWGSSVLKDPICIGCMGWLLSGFVNILFKKKAVLQNSIIIALAGFIIYLTKAYILLAFAIGIILWLAGALKQKIPNKIIRKLTFPFMLTITIIGIIFLLDNIQEALGRYALDNFAENVKLSQQNYAISEDAAGGSYFEIGEIDPSLGGMLTVAPKVINAVFYRPYVWESKNLMMLFLAIESLILLVFTIYTIAKLRFFRFWSIVFGEPLVLLCFSFSIVFGFAVGITTPNFGTLMRYKIPCIPFFVAMLIIAKNFGTFQKPNQVPLVDSTSG
jgi:hypothetical protein